jgi:hypothetical protein
MFHVHTLDFHANLVLDIPLPSTVSIYCLSWNKHQSQARCVSIRTNHKLKLEKIYQTNHKLYQKAIKYVHQMVFKMSNGQKICQGLNKYTKILNFWFENVPSGNPGLNTTYGLFTRKMNFVSHDTLRRRTKPSTQIESAGRCSATRN